MTRILTLFVSAGVILSIVACTEDGTISSDSTEQRTIVGTWVFGVDDPNRIAPELLELLYEDNLGIDSIYHTFTSDNRYTYRQTNKDGTVVEYSGTYSESASQIPLVHSIEINYETIVEEPEVSTTGTIKGIYQVITATLSNRLSLEVVDSRVYPDSIAAPAPGAEPTTPKFEGEAIDGFGSTGSTRGNIQLLDRIIEFN